MAKLSGFRGGAALVVRPARFCTLTAVTHRISWRHRHSPPHLLDAKEPDASPELRPDRAGSSNKDGHEVQAAEDFPVLVFTTWHTCPSASVAGRSAAKAALPALDETSSLRRSRMCSHQALVRDYPATSFLTGRRSGSSQVMVSSSFAFDPRQRQPGTLSFSVRDSSAILSVRR